MNEDSDIDDPNYIYKGIPEPEPNKTNFFCAICKEYYSDYIKHIESDTHLKTTYN